MGIDVENGVVMSVRIRSGRIVADPPAGVGGTRRRGVVLHFLGDVGRSDERSESSSNRRGFEIARADLS